MSALQIQGVQNTFSHILHITNSEPHKLRTKKENWRRRREAGEKGGNKVPLKLLSSSHRIGASLHFDSVSHYSTSCFFN